MSQVCSSGIDGGAIRRNAAALGAAGGLAFAASPTFAIMALLTGVSGGGDMLCSAMPDAFPLNGMVTMYLQMSAFHLAPWLKLLSRWRSGGGGATNLNQSQY